MIQDYHIDPTAPRIEGSFIQNEAVHGCKYIVFNRQNNPLIPTVPSKIMSKLYI